MVYVITCHVVISYGLLVYIIIVINVNSSNTIIILIATNVIWYYIKEFFGDGKGAKRLGVKTPVIGKPNLSCYVSLVHFWLQVILSF